MEERATGNYTDNELMGKYGMSKQTFYNTINRYRDARKETDFTDRSKAPKNPARKVGRNEIEKIREIVLKDRENMGN